VAVFDEKQKEQIIKLLEEHGVKSICPMCRNKQFQLADGYFNQAIQETIPGVAIGGTTVPSVAIVCVHCGFISQHALGALGLLPNETAEGKKEKE
jgi:hypothetical protein